MRRGVLRPVVGFPPNVIDGLAQYFYKRGEVLPELMTAYARSYFFDDFFGANLDNIWATDVAGSGIAAILHPGAWNGWVRLQTGTTASSRSTLDWNNIYSLCVQAKGNMGFVLTARLGLYDCNITGLGFSFGALRPRTGTNRYILWQVYGPASSNWRCLTADAAGSTITVSGKAVVFDEPHILRIVARADAVEFYYDDLVTPVVTHTTNIPTETLQLSFQLTSYAALAKDMRMDFVEAFQWRGA